MNQRLIQTLISSVYPPQCVMCDTHAAEDFSLCGECWRDTPFIEGLVCDACGAPLPGSGEDTGGLLCDDCMKIARPWSRGRSVMTYKDLGRKIVLSLKHGDRTELARAAAPWLWRKVKPIWESEMVIVPVPLHWSRTFKRRFNQSALLAQKLAEVSDGDYLPDAVKRVKKTRSLDGQGLDARFSTLSGAIIPHPAKGGAIEGRKVLIVDDVMTTGATLAATTEACHAAGATGVCVLALARVTKDA